MATKIFMEALSPTMEEGRLVRWLKAEGAVVANGESLAEVETDKAIMELVARGAGVLRKQLVAEGATAPVGQLVGVIAEPGEDIAALIAGAPGSSPAAPPTAAASPAPAPAAAPPAPAAPSSARGATMPASGAAEGATGAGAGAGGAAAGGAGPTSAAVAGAGRAGAAGAGGFTGGAAAAGGATDGDRVRSSPLARRLASERGIDLHAIAGSGPNGRIIKRDLETAPATAPNVPATTAPARETVPAGDYRDAALTQIRRTIARRLAESIGPVPTFYLTVELDVGRVTEMRASMAALGDEYRVSINDILIKAVATALAQHPEVNAHWLGDKIRYFNRVHIGMAVAIDDGLITPVLFDADRKRLRDIAREAKDLAARARARKLTPSEYTGSTFSISNLGMFGIDQFTAIINPPEAGILAIGAVERKPVAEGDTVAIRQRLRVTMSCDHRVIDGATGARFLSTLRRLIENPLLLVY